MRFTPQLRAFDWLVARPIAHRGLHTKNKGIIENTAGAFEAAIKGDYAIECDVQLTADGEAIVFHDDDLDRLTESKGPVKALTAPVLQKVKLKATSDRMQTLAELLEQVDGSATLVIELKSLWDGNDALAKRALQVLESYDGPYCLMSFDPDVIACLRALSPQTVRGIVADRTTDPYYNALPLAKRYSMRTFGHLAETQPHFVSYNWRELPFEPITEIRNAGHPVITWTLRSKEEASQALRYCDQVTFRGLYALKLRTVESVLDIPADQWNACANPSGFNPFVSHEFFKALEDSGSATGRTGWKAEHLVYETGKGEIAGIAPCFIKPHSQGEYVFDHGWAEAYHRAGGRYYPKLQSSVPFTPVTGPRLFSASAETRALLAKGLVSVCKELKASSSHITFLPEADWAAADKAHWLQRQDIQFHWQNQDYASFDDFLASLSSSKRKNIRKERKAVLESGISFDWVTGKDLLESHWDAFFNFYMETGSRKWGSPYLTRKFFSLISKSMGPHVLLILARREGRIIAGALNFIGSEALYGRNWGASEHHDFLHFETCYYQAIDFAIQHKLARVEAGAQGQHKLARGYLPVKTYSLHHFAHPGLSRAVGEYLEQERMAIDQDQALLAEHSPFRHETDD